MQEDVFALPPGRRRQRRPCRGLAIAGNEPPKGAESLALDLLWACRAGDGCLVLGAELRRPELAANTNARPFANAHIPNGLAVPGDLPMQVWRARAGHGVHHRMICPGSSTEIFSPVDGEMRMIILECSPTRTSTSAAPACFAARNDCVGSVGDETSICDETALKVDRRQFVPVRQRDDQIAMSQRECTRRQNHAGIRRARERRDRALDLACIVHVDGAQLHPGATDWIAPHWPVPEGMAASRRTATRVTGGAICLSSSSHFPLRPYSNVRKPVTLPPGLARLSTKPAPTGSEVSVNTIGMVRVKRRNGPTTDPLDARMTSGASATNSAA